MKFIVVEHRKNTVVNYTPAGLPCEVKADDNTYCYFINSVERIMQHIQQFKNEGLEIIDASMLDRECNLDHWAGNAGCVVIHEISDNG